MVSFLFTQEPFAAAEDVAASAIVGTLAGTRSMTNVTPEVGRPCPPTLPTCSMPARPLSRNLRALASAEPWNATCRHQRLTTRPKKERHENVEERFGGNTVRSSGNRGVKELAPHRTEDATGGRDSVTGQATGKRRPAALAAPALAVALLALTGCATGKSTALVSGAVSEADVQAIDKLFVPYAHPDAPGAAIVVILNGQAAFLRGYGLAELETNTPVTERTNFRLASLTKAFTAMAILVLVNDGRLQLDDRVGDILPDFPAYGRGIRIRHLLTHTSGLRAYQEFAPDSPTRQIKDRDVLAVLRRTDSTHFPPGSAFRYGDSGYAILALVVERASGEPFGRFLHNRILTRIGMESTVTYEPAFPWWPTARSAIR